MPVYSEIDSVLSIRIHRIHIDMSVSGCRHWIYTYACKNTDIWPKTLYIQRNRISLKMIFFFTYSWFT